MSKSILVIDTPKRCLDCPCHFTGMIKLNPSGKERFIPILCGLNNEDILSDEEKPDWCPLRDLPEKKEYNNAIPAEKQWCFESIAGWNECIGEILKGEDGNE